MGGACGGVVLVGENPSYSLSRKSGIPWTNRSADRQKCC